MINELNAKLTRLSEINYIEKVEDVDYINVKNVEYGLKDCTNSIKSSIDSNT